MQEIRTSFSCLSSKTALAPSKPQSSTKMLTLALQTRTPRGTHIHIPTQTQSPLPRNVAISFQVHTSRNAYTEETEQEKSNVFFTQTFLLCLQQSPPFTASGAAQFGPAKGSGGMMQMRPHLPSTLQSHRKRADVNKPTPLWDQPLLLTWGSFH